MLTNTSTTQHVTNSYGVQIFSSAVELRQMWIATFTLYIGCFFFVGTSLWHPSKQQSSFERPLLKVGHPKVHLSDSHLYIIHSVYESDQNDTCTVNTRIVHLSSPSTIPRPLPNTIPTNFSTVSHRDIYVYVHTYVHNMRIHKRVTVPHSSLKLRLQLGTQAHSPRQTRCSISFKKIR